MIIKDLINKLKNYPEQLEVYIDLEEGWFLLQSIETDEEYNRIILQA